MDAPPKARTRGAAVLIIGDEILSGRTQDTNTGFIARWLGQIGIPLKETRTVADDETEIVTAVRALSSRYDYVFTTGGIGPTHDDITADCMARAFNTGIDHHPVVFAELAARYVNSTIGPFNEARQRMARIPYGAALVRNKVSTAPGFQLGNVFVMAGIPAVMQAMLEDIRPRLAVGAKLTARTVSVYLGEGRIAKGLSDVQKRYPDVPLGSYPFMREGKYGTSLVARGNDDTRLAEVADALKTMIREVGGEPLDGEPQ